MPVRQMNKRFGLKKLKKIAGNDPRWSVSPHLVLESPRQFRSSQAKKKPRLLVRTDEVGNSYKRLDWLTIPRFDSTPKKVERKARLLEDTVRKKLHETGIRYSLKYNPDRIRYVFHPTKPREQIHSFGIISLFKNNTVRIKIGPAIPKNTMHREQMSFQFIFHKKNNKWFCELEDEHYAKYNPLIKKMLAFVEQGIETKQLKTARYPEISFLTWKDQPTKPELFDLIEKRYQPNIKK